MKSKIILAGGSGFLGMSLANYFKDNYDVVILSRTNKEDKDGIRYVSWDAKNLSYWTKELEGALAIINLTGKSVNCRYNQANKMEIYQSRLDSTYIIGMAIEKCIIKPSIWFNAASSTIYRNELEKANTEDEGILGSGFSVDVCKKWEAMFYGFTTKGVRKINLRIAIVLGKDKSVMIPFKALAKYGLGGKSGNGNQMFSWVHIDDFCKAIHFLLKNENHNGTFNIAAPNPTSNSIFMKTLRQNIKIPFGVSQPKWMLEMGAWLINTETELILKSRWVIPKKLNEIGFKFQHETIESALKDLV